LSGSSHGALLVTPDGGVVGAAADAVGGVAAGVDAAGVDVAVVDGTGTDAGAGGAGVALTGWGSGNQVTATATATAVTPSTTATLRSIAVRNEARTETCTTTNAVNGARTGSGMFVTTLASHHETPAAIPDFATVAISVEVGRVHDTALVIRCHTSRTRCTTRV